MQVWAFTLLVGTLVSLLTAVLFTSALLGSLARTRILRSHHALAAGKERIRWHFDFSGASRWFFTMSGLILTIGAISLATNQLNLGIDFTSGAKITAALHQGSWPCVEGDLSWNSIGEPQGQDLLVEWIGRQLLPVFPSSIALHSPEIPKPADRSTRRETWPLPRARGR